MRHRRTTSKRFIRFHSKRHLRGRTRSDPGGLRDLSRQPLLPRILLIKSLAEGSREDLTAPFNGFGSGPGLRTNRSFIPR